jgi:glycosyltransferase involved in cell wall biosynthesis
MLPLIHPQCSVVTVMTWGTCTIQAHTLSQNLYLRWSTRHNARTATCVLADSKATRQDLIRHYQIPPEKIAVVYPGRDETLTRVDDAATMDTLRKRYGLPGPYLLYIGTLHPRKNLVRLVQAFALLLFPAFERSRTSYHLPSALSATASVLSWPEKRAGSATGRCPGS